MINYIIPCGAGKSRRGGFRPGLAEFPDFTAWIHKDL